MADVFLCHNSADGGPVRILAESLEKTGLSVWLDKFNLIPGELITDAIEKELDSCGAIAVFVGETGRGPYQNEEFDYAVNVRGRQGTPIIPVILPGATPDMITGFLKNRMWVQFERSLDEVEPLRKLVAGIRKKSWREVQLTNESPQAVTPPPPSVKCPYRPLAAFDVIDHPYFCGRDRITAETVSRVEAITNDSTRCFSMVGASGSGKSSLARAGVLWTLQQRHPDWTTIILNPGARPHETLAERMLKLTSKQVDGPTLKAHGDAYLADDAMLQRSIAGALGGDCAQGRLVLLVDQFEEVFTVCKSEDARKAFIGNLLGAAQDSSGKAIVLLCLRADFYENCAGTALAQVLSKSQILVGPMLRDELRSAIRDPAVRTGSDVEDSLLTSLIKDCEEQAAPLPLLEIVLEKLWGKRDSRGRMTLVAYETMSLNGALSEHAEAVYDSLLDPQKKACQSLMLQLVEVLEDGRYARRRVPVTSLLPPVNPKDTITIARVKQTETVLGILAGPRSRLITIRLEGTTPKVEVAHEAIFRGWERLASWLDKDGEFLSWKRRLRFDVAAWKNPKTGGYLTGGTLDRAKAWLKERPDDHTEEERKFVNASYARRVVQRAGIAAAFAGVIAVSFFAYQRSEQKRQIEQMIDTAGAQMKTHPGIALLLSYDAAIQEPGQHTSELLQRAVQNGREPLLEPDQIDLKLNDFSLSEDGTVVAAAALNTILRWSGEPGGQITWSPKSIRPLPALPFNGEATKVAMCAHLIAAGDDNGQVVVWRDGQQVPGTPFQAGSKILALALAADGHVAITTEAKQAIWWNSSAAREEGRLSTADEAWAVAASPDSTTMAAGTNDGFVRFWKPPGPWRDGLNHKEKIVSFVAYSKDGRMGSGTRLGKAYRWDPGNPQAAIQMQTGDDVDSVAMDVEGKRMAVHTAKGAVTIFEGSSGKIQLSIESQPPEISKLLMDAAGTIVVAGSAKGMRVYELGDQALAGRARMSIADYVSDQEINLADCSQYMKESKCNEYLRAK